MRRVVLFGALMCMVAVLGGAVQDQQVSKIGEQLSRLTDDRPSGYLELGERVLLNDADGRDRRLAIELLVRAAFFGNQRGESDIASTACIALSEMVDGDLTRRWLWDLALLTDPSRETEWVRAMDIEDHSRDELTADAARCLYAIRYHQQPTGEELFGRAAIRERIFEAGDLAGVERGRLVQVLEREIRLGDEDSCRGRLYVADRDQRGQRLACPDHLRGLGMCANDEDLRTFLRVEMLLSGVEVESWESSNAMGMDGAMILPTIGDLAGVFRVDVGKAFYRDGRWVTTP